MFNRAAANGGDDREFQSDPLADLMFTMIAIVLLALIILLPFTAPLPPPDFQSTRQLQEKTFVLDGKAAVAIAASAAGVRLPGPAARIVGLDAIAHDAQLRHVLADARDRKAPLVLVIGRNGSEAAFELEPLLAAYGPKELYQARLGTKLRRSK